MCGLCNGNNKYNDEDYWKSLKEYEEQVDYDVPETSMSDVPEVHTTVKDIEEVDRLRIEELKRLNQYNAKVQVELNKLFGLYK